MLFRSGPAIAAGPPSHFPPEFSSARDVRYNPEMKKNSMSANFARYAWAVLGYNIFVILLPSERQAGSHAYSRSVAGAKRAATASRIASSTAIFHAPLAGSVLIRRQVLARNSGCISVSSLAVSGKRFWYTLRSLGKGSKAVSRVSITLAHLQSASRYRTSNHL